MKQTKIKYKKLDNDMIYIVDFENVGTKDALLNMLGYDLFMEYINMRIKKPFYYLSKHNEIIIYNRIRGGSRHLKLIKQGIYPIESFNFAITAMKQAGERLTKLRKEHERQKEEVKQIII